MCLINILSLPCRAMQMTGRKGRVVCRSDGSVVFESRAEQGLSIDHVNLKEKERFMNGDKVSRALHLPGSRCGEVEQEGTWQLFPLPSSTPPLCTLLPARVSSLLKAVTWSLSCWQRELSWSLEPRSCAPISQKWLLHSVVGWHFRFYTPQQLTASPWAWKTNTNQTPLGISKGSHGWD